MSLILMLKNSQIPYLIDMPQWIKVIFNKPVGEFWLPFSQMVDLFSTAYVTSLIFYIIVDYIPAEKEREKATQIIQPKLVDLYSYIQTLLAIIEYSAQQQSLSLEGDDLDNLCISDNLISCDKVGFINGEKSETVGWSFRLTEDLNMYRNLILKNCEMISAVTGFSLCDTEIICMISELQLLEFLRSRIPDADDIFRVCGITNVCHIGFGKGYKELKDISSRLKKFVNKQHTYTIVSISQEEIEKRVAASKKAYETNPDLIKLMDELQRRKKN